LDLIASLLGCHLLFRHQQQLQQLTKQHSKAPASSSSSGDGWCWCEETARILADPQQGHLQLLLPQALASLLHRPSSRAAACNMLCAAAETICMPGVPAATAGAGKAGQQQQAGAAAAAAAVNSQSSGLLLQLLCDVLVAHWPQEWQCGTLENVRAAAVPTAPPAAPTADAAATGLEASAGEQPQPQQQQQGKEDAAAAPTPTAAAAVAHMQPDALRQLLATSLLPTLQPVATCATNAASRKLFLSIAAAAAVPPHMTAARQQRSNSSYRASAAAVIGLADSTLATPAAAACQGQVAGLLALSAAAQSDRDATVRSKALALLQQAVPSFLQAWQGWNQLSALQQQQAASGSGQQQEEAAAGSSGQQQKKQQATAAETTGEQQHQDKESAGCAEQPCGSLDSCHAASSPAALQPQPSAALAAVAVGMTETPATAAAAAGFVAEAVVRLRNAAAAAATALISQLLGSSKASRLKALQVLLQLVQPLPSPTRRTSPSATAAAGTASVLQQQLVCITFPSICSILAAGQDSGLYCQSCKAVAEELLPAMAAVLQPQQALQLALYHSRTCSSSKDHAWQQQQQQEVDSTQHPEALLLASLAKCSAVQLYKLLKQQIQQAVPAVLHTPSASEGAAAAPGSSSGRCSSSSSSGSNTAPGAVRPLLVQLRRLVGGIPGREAVRRQAFMQACQALSCAAAAAADDDFSEDQTAATAAALVTAEGAEGGLGSSQPVAGAAETASEGSLHLQQEALLLAMQLLQVRLDC
jgi:hypothetical protein